METNQINENEIEPFKTWNDTLSKYEKLAKSNHPELRSTLLYSYIQGGYIKIGNNYHDTAFNEHMKEIQTFNAICKEIKDINIETKTTWIYKNNIWTKQIITQHVDNSFQENKRFTEDRSEIAQSDEKKENKNNSTNSVTGTNKEAFYVYHKNEILKQHIKQTNKRNNQSNLINIYAKNLLHKYARAQINSTNTPNKETYKQFIKNITTNRGIKAKYDIQEHIKEQQIF